eukprot:1651673-Prymnesium_polylepis.2
MAAPPHYGNSRERQSDRVGPSLPIMAVPPYYGNSRERQSDRIGELPPRREDAKRQLGREEEHRHAQVEHRERQRAALPRDATVAERPEL